MYQDSEWLSDMSNTEHYCCWTEQQIAFEEDVCAVSVAVMDVNDTGELAPVYALTTERDDLRNEPRFLTEDGWRDLRRLILQNVTAGPDDTIPSAAECDFCSAPLRRGEVIVLVRRGTIRRSERSPEGRIGTSTFEPGSISEAEIICLGCENKIRDEVIELWEDPLRQNNECANGTKTRCWRRGCSADVRACLQI